MSYPTTVAGSIFWTRRNTGSPSIGVQPPLLSSHSAASQSDGMNGVTESSLRAEGWLARVQIGIINKRIGMHPTADYSAF